MIRTISLPHDSLPLMRRLTGGLALLACVLFLSPAMAAPNWEATPAACFPDRTEKWVEGKDESAQAPCHCPPKSMCPSAGDYAKGYEFWAMPGFFVDRCCEKPKCTVNYDVWVGTRCPGLYTTGFREASFCMKYAPKPLEDTPANATENALRIKVSDELNTCLGSCKVTLNGKDVSIESLIGTTTLTASITGTGAQVVKDDATQAYDAFVACEYACRNTAAKALSLAAPKKLNENVQVIHNLQGRPYPALQASIDLPRFMAEVGPTWSVPDYQRQARVKSYLQKYPGALIDAGEGLTAKLECASVDDTVDAAVCSTLRLNNGTCSSCLEAGTQVQLADGTHVAIETIKAGQKVRGQDAKGLEAVYEVHELVKLKWDTLSMYRINDGELIMTADHPVMTTKGWRAIDYMKDYAASVDKYGLGEVAPLEVGDFLMTAKGTVKVRSIAAEETRKNGVTYNLRLKDGETFYANGIVVKDN